LTSYVYICPKCGRPHSADEFRESRFCRHCGKFLTSSHKRVLGGVLENRESAIDGIENTIEKTYELIQQLDLPSDAQIDSIEVVKQVKEYRNFWKPNRTKVILLAESHVFTNEKDFKAECRSSVLDKILLPENPSYPVKFVRFVYCLGYGENDLLTSDVENNVMGTWQYWRLFSSSVAENKDDLGFERVIKRKTSFMQRLHNKIDILRTMKRKGVWLLDASIIGLAGSGLKEYPDIGDRIIRICWKNHLEEMIRELQPQHIIIVGKRVEETLHFELKSLGFPMTVVRQPQGDRRSSRKQLEKYETCQRMCRKYS